MSGTVSVPNLFAAASSGTTPQLDADFAALVAALNNPLTYAIYAVDSGSVNAYAITLAPPPATQAALLGVAIVFKANVANTAASTLNVNALGAQSIVRPGGTAISAGQIPIGTVIVIWDGTNYVLQTGPDYKESTWTPTMTIGGSSTGITYTSQVGDYLKVGKLVTIWFGITLSSKGGLAGAVSIGGLPFPRSGTATPICTLTWANMTTAVVNMQGVISGTATPVIGIQHIAAAATSYTGTDGANLANTTLLSGVISYPSTA